MDPKQTEGQKSGPMPQAQGGFSFQTGQLNPAASAPSAPGATPANTLSTGANVARTMDDLNMGDRKSATSNSPFAKHHFNKVAPQTGDIIIEQSNKKPNNGLFFKKVKNPAGSSIASGSDTGGAFNRGRLIQFGLIFGGIALVGLVIFTVVMLINQPKKSDNSSSSEVAVTGDPEELFGEYMSFLAFGPDSSSTQDDEEREMLVYDVDLYAVTEVDKPTSESRTEYIEELNSKWSSFADSYSGDSVSASRLADVSLYFYEFAKIGMLTENDLYDIYISADKNLESAKEQALEKISSTSTHPSIEYFVRIRQDYALATLDMLSEANKANCLSEESLFDKCELNNSDALTKYAEAVTTLTNETSTKKKDILLSNALIPLADLEEEFYGDSAEDNVSVINGSEL